MNSDSFSPEEQDLIGKLEGAAKPKLSARTMDAIRHRMLAAMDAPAAANPVRRPGARRTWFAAGIAAALTLVAAGVLLTNRPPDSAAVTLTAGQTQIAAGHTATPTASVEASSTAAATITPSVTPSHTPDTSGPLVPTVTLETLSPTPVLAVTITPSPTQAAAEPTSSPTPETVIALEGPIERIEGNTIVIYGIDVAIAAGNPILNIIEVGDVVRVEGGFDEQAGFVATQVENLLDDETDSATVGLDGPIESIDGEFVTVNGIELVLSALEPTLETLGVGDFLSVRGNIEMRGSRFVLVAVSVEVLPNMEIATPEGCYYHAPGMGMGMGHWHCEGMGMGMGQLP